MAADYKTRAVLEFVNKAGPGVKSATKDLGGLTKVAKALGPALTVAGVVAAGKAAYELGVLGAQSLRTKQAFEAISGSAFTATDNLDAMRRATRGAMNEQDMMASANQLLQMGLAGSADELEQVTTMATRLGSAMGKGAGPAVSEFSLMLANQSIPRLDTFGISASKVRARILELQAATPGLSREMAFMTATMEEGEAAMGRLGEASDDELLASERLEASWEDLKVMAGEMLAPAMADVAGAAVVVTGAILDAEREMQDLRKIMGNTAVEIAQTEDTLGYLNDATAMLAGDVAVLSGETYEAGSAMTVLKNQARAFREQVEAGMSPMAQYTTEVSAMAEAAGEATDATKESSEALIEYLDIAGDWTKTLGAYGDYTTERISLTRQAEQEIAELEEHYAARRYTTVSADEEAIFLLEHDYAQKRDNLLGASLYAETEADRRAYEIKLGQADAGHAEQLTRLGEHTAMVEGITREEADKRIAEIREGLSGELATLEEGWTAEREALRMHFAEVEVAYLESRLKTTETSAEEREAIEGAMRAIQLEFGLVTEDALAMADAQNILRDAIGKLTSEEYAQVMSDWQVATEDGVITVDELLETTGQLDDEMASRLLKLFPKARDITEEVRDAMRQGGKAAIELQEGTEDATAALLDFKDEIVPVNTETEEFSRNIGEVYSTLEQMDGDYYVTVHYASTGSLPPWPPGGGGGGGGGGAPPPLQTGTMFHRGGWAIIGDAGPELVALPRGSRVWPTSAPETRAATGNRYNYGGDTYIINDRLAMALALEQKRRRRIERIERM